MCDCIKEIRKKLIEDYGDPNLTLDTKIYWNFKSGISIEKAGHMEFSFREKNKSGEFKKKQTKTFMAFNCCPFCGKEYNTSENELKNNLTEV